MIAAGVPDALSDRFHLRLQTSNTALDNTESANASLEGRESHPLLSAADRTILQSFQSRLEHADGVDRLRVAIGVRRSAAEVPELRFEGAQARGLTGVALLELREIFARDIHLHFDLADALGDQCAPFLVDVFQRVALLRRW